jgi:hypothetical protein
MRRCEETQTSYNMSSFLRREAGKEEHIYRYPSFFRNSIFR